MQFRAAVFPIEAGWKQAWRALPVVLLAANALAGDGGERVMESVLPALAYGGACSSTVTLHSLADQAVTVEMEAHREGGALVALSGQAGQAIQLQPGQQSSYRLTSQDETSTAWVKVRERIPGSRPSPVVALSGVTECRSGEQMQSAPREVTYPTRNPWFSGDVAELRGALITLINTSEQAAQASACYSSGTLYFVPGRQLAPDLLPVCSSTADVQVPPFGTREFPVERGGNSHFALKTRGAAIVLQMLRPEAGGTRLFTVDSSIRFGEEVPGR